MTEASGASSRSEPDRRWVFPLLAAVFGALVVAILASSVWWAGRPPTSDSVEAGFARDMQVHHAQAVEMALVVRDRTDDPEVRALAYDIATTQQQQLGQMAAWLQLWGLPATGSQPQMAWMGEGGSEAGGMLMKMSADGRMPGMASGEQLERLRRSSDIEAEELFLQLMIRHHDAGAAMARAANGQVEEPVVQSLASAILTSQTAEVRVMKRMLADRREATSNQEQ